MKTLLAGALAAATLLLSGCLVPEKFAASVEFKDDLSYSYSYEGTTAFVPALMEMAQKKGISAQSEAKMRADAQKYKADHPDIKTLDYDGNGRFKTNIEGRKPPGATTQLLDTLVIGKDKQGNQAVIAKMQAKDVAPFKDLGMNIDGKLVVKLPSKAKILQTNGTTTKGLFGLGPTSVEWVVQKAEQRPQLFFTTDN